MKTTIDIADSLLVRSKSLARREHITLRSLIEAGLTKVLDEHGRRRKKFKLRSVRVGSGGFTPEFENGSWDAVRDEIYKGHGS